MLKPFDMKKTAVFVILMLMLGAGLIPTLNGTRTPMVSYDATSITTDIAKQVALIKLRELNKTNFFLTEPLKIIDEKQEPLCYVFRLIPQGYLIVTGSYELPPVIAYSFTSDYDEGTDSNPLYLLLYHDLTTRLKNIQLIPELIIKERHLQWESYINGIYIDSGRFEQWPPEGSTPTGGWLRSNWHQSAPYNNFCPLDLSHGGTRSVAGCPAVAMAKILNYHNTTMDVVFDDSDDYYHNYLGNQYWIDNNYVTYDFPSFPQLNSHLSTLQSHYESQIPPTDNDKAAITFACGVAARQVYATSGSGTYGVNQAYQAYQRFNCSTIELLYPTHPDLYDRLSNNMKDALPAHLAVVNPTWTAGHNLVVDGYNTNEYYHLNFGWGGSNNGWYLIPNEIPIGLTVIEGVIVDILENTAVPDLTCEGTLEWMDVIPKETITGSFTLSNTGEAGSYLDWSIADYPTWGTWMFTPPSGVRLTPENGPITIDVRVIAPKQRKTTFTGNVTIVNSKNSSDYETIPILLVTPYKRQCIIIELLQALMERFPNAFPLLHLILTD